ncbi:Clathrin/coatomer adaptor, adaptin-like protein, partial [Mycena galericulata]
LANQTRVFFCKYNDPLYVKIKKLNIKVRLAAEGNVDALLSELKEYASEVVYFVRNSIKAIAQTAVKIDAAAEWCVNVLLDLIVMRVRYVVEEVVVVMKVCHDISIFRAQFRPRTLTSIHLQRANLDDLDEPEAKASRIGEYAGTTGNADDLLGIV